MEFRKLIQIMLLLCIATAAFSQEGKAPFEKEKADTVPPQPKKDSAYYSCPVHTDVRMAVLGQCPICGRTLEKHPVSVTQKQNEKECMEMYSCPVHPDPQFSKPGKCTKCGATLLETQTG